MKKVPIKKETDYFASKSNLSLLEACVEKNEPALLIGETGTGKTTLIREVAKEYDKTLIRISVNGSMGVEEILGKWLVNKGTTVWQDGILTMALRAGHWVVMDEINAALPEILFVLHSLLDDDHKIVLPEKDNEIVYPHAEFRFFATMNPPEEYAGTKDMNKALMSRFTAVLNIEVLSESDEVKLLVKKGVDKDIAYKLVRLATALRKYKNKDDIFYFCSTRDLVQAGVLIAHKVSLSDAVTGSIINKMSPKEFLVVKTEFNSIVADTKKLPFTTIEEMVKALAGREAEIKTLKESYELLLAKKEAEVRGSIKKEVSDEAREDILKRIMEIAKTTA